MEIQWKKRIFTVIQPTLQDWQIQYWNVRPLGNLRFLKSKIQHLQFRKNKNTLLKSLNRNDIFQEEAFLFRAEKFIIVQDSQGFSLAISTLKFWEADGKFSKSCYHYVCHLILFCNLAINLIQFSFISFADLSYLINW